jgi:NAD(P)-dependent dehydrogenase (short-subunit alcohol dehydrogenase family)
MEQLKINRVTHYSCFILVLPERSRWMSFCRFCPFCSCFLDSFMHDDTLLSSTPLSTATIFKLLALFFPSIIIIHCILSFTMWTGNLSYWLFPPRPPGRPVQQVNAWLHREPIDALVHGVYWCIVLMLLAPLLGMAALWIGILQAILWCVSQSTKTTMSFGRTVLEQAQAHSVELAVVITGCDSGFGKDLAAQLAEKGFVVFVGCLQEESIKLFGPENDKIRPILLDVTKDDQVAAAANTVVEWLSSKSSSNKRYLHAIVNNAGIGKIGYVDWVTLSDFKQCMDVNCWGHVRMTKAFLPIFKRQAAELLVGQKTAFYAPQIINMISMAGTSRGGLALVPYEVSKTAALAFSDGLRLEMKPWGVRVVDVNPSFHTTPLTTNMFEKLQRDLWTPLPKELKDEYGQDFFENYRRHVERMMSQQWDPNITVEAMVRALLSFHPPCRINVGMDSKFGLLLYSMYPTWLRNVCTQLLMPDQTPAMLKDSANDKSKKEN